MNRNRLRIRTCCLAATIMLAGSGSMAVNAAPAAGLSDELSTTISSVTKESTVAGGTLTFEKAVSDSQKADENKENTDNSSEDKSEKAENETPVVKSEYADIAIAQVDNYVNVRSTPGEDGEVLGKLYDKSAATVEGEENGWYKITSGSVTGYVKKEFVVVGNEELARAVGRRMAKVNTETLKVRTDASTDAPVLGLVPGGDDLTVTEERDGWVKVSVEEGEGFVSTDYVSLSTEFVKAESKAEEEARLAKEEAERILSEAKAKADAILNDAQTQKAELLEQAKEEGRTRGYDEGKAKADAEEQEMQRHLQQLEESLNTDYRNKLQHMEQQVVEVVVHVFEKVFHIQFDDKTEILLSLVSDAIMGIEGSKDFRIRVAEVNFEFMENHRHELEERVGEDISLEMIADPMLEENQCMIETDSGIFNCSLGVQLENLIKDLKSLSIN